jgi:hypothetical protein
MERRGTDRYRWSWIGFGAFAAMAAAPAMAEDDAFAGFEPVPLAQVEIAPAAQPLDLVAALVELPEDIGSGPLLSLSVTGEGGALIVDAQLRGYADDAILGENLRARLERGEAGWVLVKLGRQWVCARGEHAGRPAPLCP